MTPGALVLIAAALLRVPARRLRALARGDDGALRDWIANESAWRLAEARRDARLAGERIDAAGARVIALGTPAYPAGLLALSDPPPFLIARGELGSESAEAGTAIVGARAADETSRAFAHAFAGRVPAPIVSGLALGVDGAAHAGALAAGVPTVAYVGHGLGATYPPEHLALEDAIVAAGGGVASERLPGEPATRWSLVRRDRLQAAHAAAVVLVCSEAGGGALHALRAAKRLGRARFACEPRDGPGFDGNRFALADGAVGLPWIIEEAATRFANARRES